MWKVLVAFGAAALTVLSLVGAGVDGAFTSAVTVESDITAGTFSLRAIEVGSGSWTGSNGAVANLPGSNVPVGGSAALDFELGSGAPGKTYYYEFSVFDTGSLPGTIDAVSFAPDQSSMLESSSSSSSSVSVSYQLNGAWISAGAGPVPASLPETFTLPGGETLAPQGAPSTPAGPLSQLTVLVLLHVGKEPATVQLSFGSTVGSGAGCGSRGPSTDPFQGGQSQSGESPNPPASTTQIKSQGSQSQGSQSQGSQSQGSQSRWASQGQSPGGTQPGLQNCADSQGYVGSSQQPTSGLNGLQGAAPPNSPPASMKPQTIGGTLTVTGTSA